MLAAVADGMLALGATVAGSTLTGVGCNAGTSITAGGTANGHVALRTSPAFCTGAGIGIRTGSMLSAALSILLIAANRRLTQIALKSALTRTVIGEGAVSVLATLLADWLGTFGSRVSSVTAASFWSCALTVEAARASTDGRFARRTLEAFAALARVGKNTITVFTC